MADLTELAESCIQFALDYLYQQACARRGTPILSDGTAQNLVVLGMGKLGAWELNYSSDIDLIFAYQQDGVLADRKETSYGEFFSRICRSLVKVLDEITADGFVFRTDIRLRPFGDSGPIIMTLMVWKIIIKPKRVSGSVMRWLKYVPLRATRWVAKSLCS